MVWHFVPRTQESSSAWEDLVPFSFDESQLLLKRHFPILKFGPCGALRKHSLCLQSSLGTKSLFLNRPCALNYRDAEVVYQYIHVHTPVNLIREGSNVPSLLPIFQLSSFVFVLQQSEGINLSR